MGKKYQAEKMLLLCFSTYLVVYILRTNFSAAMPAIGAQLELSNQELGLVGSIFFLVYALGQLINGFLADRLPAFPFVTLALFCSVAANGALAFGDSLIWILAFWALNGYVQSIFWPSLTRIVSVRFPKERHSTVAMIMSSSMVGGFIVSWAILGKLLHGAAWRYFFWIPALLGALLLPLWGRLAVKNRREGREQGKSSRGILPALKLILEKRLWLVCLVCLCLGFIKESVSLWGPTILTSVLHVELDSSFFLLCLIPLGNLGGMILAKVLIDRLRGREFRILFFLFSVIAAGALVLYLCRDSLLFLTIGLIVETSAMSYGCNTVLLSFIPMAFSRYGLVSTLAGMFDFSSYMGAALSSLIMGMTLTGADWGPVPLLWLSAGAMALVFCLAARKWATLE